MISLFIAGGIGLLVSGFGAPILIRWLRHWGIGQQIRNDGPEGHSAKAGTPTMGGLVIVVATIVGFGVSHIEAGTTFFPPSGIMVLAIMIGAAGVGVIDDWIKVRRQRSLGLNKRAKIAVQVVVAVGFALGVVYWSGVTTTLSFTRYSSPGINLGTVGWVLFATVVVVGSANAVNLTDGVDGLAAGSATFGLGILAIIGYWQSRHESIYASVHGGMGVRNPLDLALVSVAMAGACAGFLWWNAAPARLFMGDTGSLAIGAVLAALCLQMQLDLLLPILGGLFVLETLSVVAQVASYRIFKRRIFRMAPLHHHFELLGWPETTVIIRFWILAGLCVAAALGIFYADFISVGLAQ
ncbi:MAG: phospho-N-acetylmuramoyl-pentapeptide-transferase [Acidimicrobiales bacterium]